VRVPTVTLGSIAKITSGGTPDRSNPAYWSGTIPWVKTAQIQNSTIGPDDIDEWITRDGLEQSASRMIPQGTILMAMYGQGRTRGQVAILGVAAAINQACAAILLQSGANRDYIFQQLRFRYNAIRALSNTGSQENLNSELIREIAFPLPPHEEQRKIAQVLGAWDTAIERVKQLIEAKRKLCDSLTLRLYTLSDREGYSRSFRELLTESGAAGSGGRLSKKLTIKLYGRGVVAKDARREGSDQTQYFVRRAGQLIYSKLDFLNGAFGIVPQDLDGYESTQDLPAFDISQSVNPSWLLGYLTRPAFYSRQLGLARGQRKARRVHPSDFLAATLSVPARELQDRIAEALGAARSDLDNTSQLLECLEAQKRGLMQRLLSCQWQLPPRSTSRELETV
jgi:type I restriction enzyme S subunit